MQTDTRELPPHQQSHNCMAGFVQQRRQVADHAVADRGPGQHERSHPDGENPRFVEGRLNTS